MSHSPNMSKQALRVIHAAQLKTKQDDYGGAVAVLRDFIEETLGIDRHDEELGDKLSHCAAEAHLGMAGLPIADALKALLANLPQATVLEHLATAAGAIDIQAGSD